MISVHNLHKTYDGGESRTHALAGVTFEITQGEFVAIMGPSGSGKSTLLHILGFLDRPTHGVYTFLGKRMDELSDNELAHVRNEEMGFVFQSFNLLNRSRVYENVELPLLYGDISVHERSARVHHAIASVGLTEKTYAEAGKLSGGQQQRVAIARALVNNPNIIFADEPTGNLDSASGAQVMAILSELHKHGKTIILVTHETYTAQFAERVMHVRDGLIESDKHIPRSRTAREEFFK